eukprot:GHVP01057995.1.p1 GENE.GHVP01057995.1~~GHVP01057995.1.p1  ORF type:complete len:120 (-),score=15.17 GHVP01057995.1:83-442(-)
MRPTINIRHTLEAYCLHKTYCPHCLIKHSRIEELSKDLAAKEEALADADRHVFRLQERCAQLFGEREKAINEELRLTKEVHDLRERCLEFKRKLVRSSKKYNPNRSMTIYLSSYLYNIL